MTEINKKLDLATIPPTNNDGEPYILPLDIYKEGYQAYNISNWFKGRVGDNGTPFAIRWYSHGRLLNIQGMRPFIEGQVGDYTIDDSDPDNVRIDMAEDASNIHIVGDVDDTQAGGVAIYRLISQAFPKSGIFYGKIGFMGTQDDGTLVNTGVDIVFKVLADRMNMLGARQFYVSELEKAWLDLQEKIRQYDQQYKDQTQQQADQFKQDTENALADLNTKIANEIKRAEDTLDDTQASIDANLASLKKIATEISIMEVQIEADEIVTKPELAGQLNDMRNDFKNIVSQNAKGTPQVIASLDELKKTYPTGSTGVYLSTADNHLYSYIDGTWSDLGLYQEKGLGKHEVNYDNLNYETTTGYHNPQNLIDLKEINRGFYYYVDANNKGEAIANPDFCYVRVPVNENQRLFISGSTNSGVFVDEKENTVSSFAGAQNFDDGTVKNKTYMEYSGIVPKNAKFLYQSFSLKNIPYAYIGYDSEVVPPNSVDTRLINNSSVKTNKLSQVYIPFKSNFVDNSKIIKGQYVAFSTGELIANPDFSVTDYVEIDPRLKWQVSVDTGFADSQLAFYDENKYYISGLELEYNLPKTDIPANAQYARFTMHKGQEDGFTVKPLAKIDNDLIKDESIANTKLSHVYVPFKSNFVDNSKIIKGQYVAFSTGELIANSDFSVTDYVEIDPRLKWQVSVDTGFADSQLAFYDENKYYISGLELEYNLPKTDIPANARYARFTMHKGQEDGFVVKPFAKIDTSYLDLDKLKDNLKVKELVVSKDGNGDFTTIKDALLYTWTHPDAIIRVAAGVYDIYQELGEDFFKNYDKTFSDKFSEEPFSRGLPLCNNVHLIFDSRAKVIFNYPGDNEHVLSYFSLFSCSPKGTGVIVDGLNAVASNCHYIIHDDLGSYNPGHVANEFKNLNLSLDNTKNTAEHKSTCIGGGLTFDEHVEIKDSYFYGANGFVTVSYHNHAMDNSRSQLVLKDCYFEDGNSFQAINFGPHNPNSLFLVSNNSFGVNPQWDSKFQSTDPTNVIVKHWNNEIRNTTNIPTRTADNDTSNVINLS